MRKFTFLLFLVAVLGCEKDADNGGNADNIRLVSISADNKVYQSFEYSNSRLIKENNFGFCTTTPLDEFAYSYQGSKLDNIDITLRSPYSSSIAACDPSAGERSNEKFEYDNAGRLVKITRPMSHTTFQYNAKGQVEKQLFYASNNLRPYDSTSFNYDQVGNIIEETHGQGTSYYQYDDKKNPFYLMKQRPGWISAFNTSPNNVIKGTGASQFERSILSYTVDLPSRVFENGVEYQYVYK